MSTGEMAVRGSARSKNIVVPPLDIHAWATKEPREAIHELFDHVVAGADSAIAWYARNKASKARLSRGIRATAIVLGVLGGLAPLLVSLAEKDRQASLSQLGYVAIAVATGLVVGDRFFGVSSAWMRYMTTLFSLQRLLTDLRLEWAAMLIQAKATLTAEDVERFLTRARTFQATVQQLVEKETEAWATEFRTNLADLEKLLAQQKEAGRKAVEELEKAEQTREEGRKAQERFGAINVSVAVSPPTAAVDGPLAIRLDGAEVQRGESRTFAMREVTPGLHVVGVTARVDTRSVQAETTIDVKPGQIAAVTLTLGV
jgi:hypothetical protein